MPEHPRSLLYWLPGRYRRAPFGRRRWIFSRGSRCSSAENGTRFDARNNVPRIGRLLMARGRDAADVALTTTFGVNQLLSFKVITEEVSEEALNTRRDERST